MEAPILRSQSGVWKQEENILVLGHCLFSLDFELVSLCVLLWVGYLVFQLLFSERDVSAIVLPSV